MHHSLPSPHRERMILCDLQIIHCLRPGHQVVIVVDPHVQDGLLFHLAGPGVVGQDSLTHLQGADGLFAMIGGDLCRHGEATLSARCRSQIGHHSDCCVKE